MRTLQALAPAKVNLGLFVGPRRPGDDRHELATVMQSISLADTLTLAPAPAGSGGDVVAAAGVPGAPGDNLALRALGAFRDAIGWRAPPLLLSIEKQIPVAAGLGGGSADAAAALRLAAHAAGAAPELLLELAAELGADVPAQVVPGRWLATGAGERLAPLPAPTAGLGVLVLPVAAALSTADVYAEADRLGVARDGDELARVAQALAEALAAGAALPPARLLHNDLQAAALSLCPQIADVLALAVGAGAELALVSGSGPTVLGLFSGERALARSESAARELRGRVTGAVAAAPVDGAAGRAHAPVDAAEQGRARAGDSPVRNNPGNP